MSMNHRQRETVRDCPNQREREREREREKLSQQSDSSRIRLILNERGWSKERESLATINPINDPFDELNTVCRRQ